MPTTGNDTKAEAVESFLGGPPLASLGAVDVFLPFNYAKPASCFPLPRTGVLIARSFSVVLMFEISMPPATGRRP